MPIQSTSTARSVVDAIRSGKSGRAADSSRPPESDARNGEAETLQAAPLGGTISGSGTVPLHSIRRKQRSGPPSSERLPMKRQRLSRPRNRRGSMFANHSAESAQPIGSVTQLVNVLGGEELERQNGLRRAAFVTRAFLAAMRAELGGRVFRRRKALYADQSKQWAEAVVGTAGRDPRRA